MSCGGCCDQGLCVGGSSDTACGSGGLTCKACTIQLGERCTSGKCAVAEFVCGPTVGATPISCDDVCQIKGRKCAVACPHRTAPEFIGNVAGMSYAYPMCSLGNGFISDCSGTFRADSGMGVQSMECCCKFASM
jgi:hypothetical protein